MAWYRNGTIALTNGSTEVTGASTVWVGKIVPGSILVIETTPAVIAEVLDVSSDNTLTLAKPYAGATATGVSYAAAPTQAYLPEVAQRVTELLSRFASIKTAWEEGTLVPVTSVGGKVGDVSKADLALDKVNNTADADKPVSIATQAALDLKAPKNNPTFTGTVSGVTKTHVGLDKVDNTADADKPVSVAQQTALDLKAPKSNPTFTGTVSGITKAMVGLANVNNTADVDKPISVAQQAALDLKANAESPAFTGTPTGITKAHVGLGNVNNTADVDKPVSAATQSALDGVTTLARASLVGQCRLAFISSTQLRLVRENGQFIIVNGVPVSIPVGGVNLSNSGLTAATLYYVYAYVTGGTLTLEASTTVPTVGDMGISIKTNDASRSLVGMAYVGTGSIFRYNNVDRHVASWFNRRRVSLSADLGNGSNNTGTPTYVGSGASMLVWAGEHLTVDMYCIAYNDTTHGVSRLGISLNASGNAGFAGSYQAYAANSSGSLVAHSSGASSENALYLIRALCWVENGSLGTFNSVTAYAHTMA